MALHIQLDLFDDPQDENIYLKKQIDTLISSQDKLRKGLFARHSELERNFTKQMFEFQKQLDAIQRQMLMITKNLK